MWISIVYILSFICYLPLLLDKRGIVIPDGLLFIRYLFVCIPAIITVLFLICEHNLKTYIKKMFSEKITTKQLVVTLIFVAMGLLVSYCYSFIANVDVFQNTYSSILTLITGCVYLFITGFIEEIAWRGFLLERVSFERKSFCNVVIVGIVWSAWHIPMWAIRNSLGVEQIFYLCIWTILVSCVLGISYYQCRNIVFVTILHMIFNVCYLAPIQYNIAVLAITMVIWAWHKKKKLKRI